jgi:hypothetical protein
MSIELPSNVSASDVREYVGEVIYPHFLDKKLEYDHIKHWVTGCQPDYLLDPDATSEKRALLKLAKTPWLGLVVDSFTQCLLVDGYRSEGSKDNIPGPWRTWNANGMQARQVAIHRAALTYGHAYASALVGTALDGSDQAVLRGWSPRRCLALYVDPVSDDYPKYAIVLMQDGKTLRFFDEQYYYDIPMPHAGDFPEDIPMVQVYHGTGVVPIVRYLNTMDLDGRVLGEVEKLVPIASRIDKTLFDRLLTQHYNSFKIITATGLDELTADASDEDAAAAEQELSQNRRVLATGNPNAQFGVIPETALAPFVQAFESDIATLESVSQLPPSWSSRLVNLSADALAAARAATTQKIYERKINFGAAHNQLMRLAAHLEGDKEASADFEATVTWADTEVRSLSQVVDAWGKAAQMLGVPRWATWRKIPGVTDDEARMWWENLLEDSPEAQFLRYYGQQQSQNGNPDPDTPSVSDSPVTDSTPSGPAEQP